MSFTLDISKFVEKAKVNPAAATKKAFFEVSNRIVLRTPVLDGFLRNNWQAGVNSPKLSRIDTADVNGGAAKTSIDLASKAKTSNDFTLYLNNNLPYARTAEFGLWPDGPGTVGGYSRKAPQGMVRVSLAEFQNELDKAARSLNK